MPLLETILLVSGGLRAGGQILSGIGNFGAARDAEREGKRLAADAIARGERDVELYGMDLDQLLGTQRTNAAASGLDVEFGDVALLRDQTERFGAEDINTIRENAQREAFALRRSGRNAAQNLRMQGVGDFLGATDTVLNLGANAYDSWSRTRSAGKLAARQTSDLMGRRSAGYAQDLQRRVTGGR